MFEATSSLADIERKLGITPEMRARTDADLARASVLVRNVLPQPLDDFDAYNYSRGVLAAQAVISYGLASGLPLEIDQVDDMALYRGLQAYDDFSRQQLSLGLGR